MRRIALALALLAALTGCNEKAAGASSSAGAEFRVDRMFTRDSCTVYRVSYGSWLGYFPQCDGPAGSAATSAEGGGKNCTRPVGEPTSYALKD